jgi:hypothetical protein
MRQVTAVGLAVLASAILCLASSQSADAKVTKAVLSAAPAEFQGNCPGVITFNGTITVDAPGKVKYIFTRNDGAIDTITKTLVFKKAGTQKVKTTWTIGGEIMPFYEGWEAIKVTAPNNFVSGKANFKLKCNPPLNSAISAHGNTDWHINTANEFLFGVNMGGVATAANHAPEAWSKQHMHVGLTNTSGYYYDKSIVATGEDTNTSSGIDRKMLFFYAGHGNPGAWSALGEGATQANVRLANITGKGTLRYYWQCSCEVFAHGPLSAGSCAGAVMEYGCPQNFDGSHDSENMRNVFERWGPSLNKDLRMACGGSTSMWCWDSNVNAVWDDYNNHGMNVADSFIDGFSSSHPGVVPLCITRGGANIADTPLYTDGTFTNLPNTSGSGYYHILYPGGSQAKHVPLTLPHKLFKLKVVAADLPARMKGIARSLTMTHQRFAGKKAMVRVHPSSGSVHMISERRAHGVERAIGEEEYLARAAYLLKEMQWDGNDVSKPVITRLLTASMPIEGGAKDVTHGQKAVMVKYNRQVDVNGVKVNVLGAGGQVKILMTAGGNILNANRVWRKVKGFGAEMELKSFEEARDEAIKKLSDAERYKLADWDWGYKEPAGNVEVSELPVVFQFGFIAQKHEDTMDYPPVLIEISAEKM